MRVSALLLATLLLAAPAWADPEGAHPLTDKPFPLMRELKLEAPVALLIWRQEDGITKRKFGEAKLVELVGSRPKLRAYSLQLRMERATPVTPYGSGMVTPAWISPGQVTRLQAAETPFIVTVDQAGRIFRLSYVDHWPLLTVASPRFGPIPSPPPSEGWWQRVRHALGWR